MSVIQRVQKRRKYPITVDGDTIYLRTLSYEDAELIDTITEPVDKLFYAVGQAMIEDSGEPAFPPIAGETPSEFAARAKAALKGMGQDTLKEISEAITKITKAPSTEAIVKN